MVTVAQTTGQAQGAPKAFVDVGDTIEGAKKHLAAARTQYPKGLESLLTETGISLLVDHGYKCPLYRYISKLRHEDTREGRSLIARILKTHNGDEGAAITELATIQKALLECLWLYKTESSPEARREFFRATYLCH